MVTKQMIFYQLFFFGTLMDALSTRQSFTLLGLRSDEIPGEPPLVSDMGTKTFGN